MINNLLEDTNMTPCEELGYKVGDKFEAISDGYAYKVGTIVTLDKDDGTDVPYFRDCEGDVLPMCLSRLAPLKKAPIKPEDEVTITTTYGELAKAYAILGEANGSDFGNSIWRIARGLLDYNQEVYDHNPPTLTDLIDYSCFQDEWLAALFPKEDPKTNQLNEVISTLEKELIKAKNQLKEIKGE